MTCSVMHDIEQVERLLRFSAALPSSIAFSWGPVSPDCVNTGSARVAMHLLGSDHLKPALIVNCRQKRAFQSTASGWWIGGCTCVLGLYALLSVVCASM